MDTIKKTASICDVCLKRIPARTVEKKGRIYVEKRCPEHGKFSGAHVWDDPEVYRELAKTKTVAAKSAQVAFVVSYKCNLNCPVCFAKANETDVGEMKIGDLDQVDSYDTIFLTGGEPTVSEKLPQMMRILRKRKKKIVMFTNGIKFAEYDYASIMKKSGLCNVILQFDSFNDEGYEYIRGRKLLQIKLEALKNMIKLRIPVYLQATVLKNKNFSELPRLFEYAFHYRGVKAVALNHLWKLGRYHNKDFIPTSVILKKTNEILGITNRDWTESTRLLIGLDKLFSVVRKQKRVFCKCNLKCLVLRHRGENIPLPKIFNTAKIIPKIEKIYARKSRWGFWAFIAYFFLVEGAVNFFRNRNFRIFLGKLVKNRRYFWSKEHMLFNPFYFMVINVFPTTRNMDFDFVDQCNFNAVSPGNFTRNPACVHRINILRRKVKIEMKDTYEKA